MTLLRKQGNPENLRFALANPKGSEKRHLSFRKGKTLDPESENPNILEGEPIFSEVESFPKRKLSKNENFPKVEWLIQKP